MQDGRKAIWSIPFVSEAFFLSLKQNFIAYCSSKVSLRPDCIFEIHQLWQSGFRRVYSNSCCRCSFEAEIIKIGQSSFTMYSNTILNFQESTTMLNAHTKKAGNLSFAPSILINTSYKYFVLSYFYIYMPLESLPFHSLSPPLSLYIYIYMCVCVCVCVCVCLSLSLSLYIYIYMYIERDTCTHPYIHVCVFCIYACIYIYIYIYIYSYLWI